MAKESGRRGPRTVWLKPSWYRPTKEEREEEFTIDASPEEAAVAVVRPARIVSAE